MPALRIVPVKTDSIAEGKLPLKAYAVANVAKIAGATTFARQTSVAMMATTPHKYTGGKSRQRDFRSSS